MSVYICIVLKGFYQIFVFRKFGQNTQLYLGIIYADQFVAFFCGILALHSMVRGFKVSLFTDSTVVDSVANNSKANITHGRKRRQRRRK
jgi:hypothetical protein